MTRNAFVTGGSKGIGAAIAKELKNAGYQVAINYGGDDAAAEKFTRETGIPHFKWNVGNYEQCVEGMAAVEKLMGPIDILVNNAGKAKDHMMHRMKHEDWDEIIQTNLNSVFYVTKQVLDGMRARKFGRIINISSINAQKGQLGQVNYCASKAGMIGFTKGLAKEVARLNITVNAVAPGYIDTTMLSSLADDCLQKIISKIPMDRLGTAEEVAKAVRFLASDEASYITGSTLSINGGMYSAS
ncbi:MAG: beta-ketoacyl-ACP reductase [Alphaproteobacteria bacterium]|nr:beta-ketoacyl-ACP reductase [Alphaproteobacteria bacterium]